MFLTDALARADFLQDAVLAEQVLGLGLRLLSVVHLLLTIDQATEVRFLAAVALVKRASVVCKLLRLAKVSVTFSCEALVAKDALLPRIFHRLGLDLPFVANHGSQNFSDGSGEASWLYVLLAARA